MDIAYTSEFESFFYDTERERIHDIYEMSINQHQTAMTHFSFIMSPQVKNDIKLGGGGETGNKVSL